jgi:hypothetical protein
VDVAVLEFPSLREVLDSFEFDLIENGGDDVLEVSDEGEVSENAERESAAVHSCGFVFEFDVL